MARRDRTHRKTHQPDRKPKTKAQPGTPDTGSAGDRKLALRVVTQPRDTNHYGTVFGGVILSYIDQAGFVEARRHGAHRWVTAGIDRVDFKAPVHTGDVVNFFATTLKTGTTSVTVLVEVEAERFASGKTAAVTTATLTLVAIDSWGRPIPFRSPPTVSEDRPLGGNGA